MRGATSNGYRPVHLQGVSIHAPHAGRDATPFADLYGMIVSIHAPHAGRDLPIGLRAP